LAKTVKPLDDLSTLEENLVTMELHPLRQFRKERAWTQERLAKFLGVHWTTVARWELGTRQINLEQLGRVSRLTGIEPALLRPDIARVLG
jgi:transcriptional regulator with XRE-family HTH domain